MQKRKECKTLTRLFSITQAGKYWCTACSKVVTQLAYKAGVPYCAECLPTSDNQLSLFDENYNNSASIRYGNG